MRFGTSVVLRLTARLSIKSFLFLSGNDESGGTCNEELGGVFSSNI